MADQSFVVELILEGADGFKRSIREAFQAGEIGAEELAKKFQEVEKVANGAISSFQKVQSAASAMRTGFNDVVASGGRVVDAYNKLETASTRFVRNTTLLATGIAGATTALVAFVASGVKAADALNDQAAAANLTTERYQDLQFAAAQAGIAQGALAQGLTRFNTLVANSAREQARTLTGFVDRVSNIKFPGLIEIGPQFADTQRLIREGALKMQADLRALGKNVALATLTEELTKLANGGEKAREEFERLTGSTLSSGNKALDDLRSQADGGKRSLQQLGIVLKRTADGSLDTEAAILDVADAFSKLPDGPEKTAFALEFFGRNVGPKLIPFLNQGRKGIAEYSEEIAKLKLTAEEVKIGDRVSKELDLISFASTKLREKLALVFAPSLEFGVNTLRGIIKDRQEDMLAFARSIQQQVFPHVKAFFDMLAGRQNLSEAGENMEQLKVKAIAFGTAVKSAVVDVIIPAFQFLIRALDQVAKIFNSIFGTKLTGEALAVAIVIARITGAFGLLTAALGLARAAAGFLFTLFTRLAAVIGWPAALATALATLALRFESVQRIADLLHTTFKALFGLDISGSTLFVGLAALGTALVSMRAKATVAAGGLGALARSPLTRFLGVAGIGLALFGDKLLGTAKAAEQTGENLTQAGEKAKEGSKHFIDVKKQLAEKQPDNLRKEVQQTGKAIEIAGKQASTATGFFDKLQSEFEKELDKPLTVDIQPGSLADKALNIKPSVDAAKEALRNSEDAVVSTLFSLDKKIEEGVSSTISTITSAWTSFFDWLSGKREQVESLGPVAATGNEFAGPPVTVPGGATPTGTTIDTIGAGADAARQKVEALQLSVQQLGPIVAAATGNEFEQARAKLVSISDSAEQLVQKFRDGVQPAFVNAKDISENLGKAVISITPSAQELVQKLRDTEAAAKGASQGFDEAGFELAEFEETISVGFGASLDNAEGEFQETSTAMSGFMDTVTASIDGAIAKMNELAAAAQRAAAAAAAAAASGGGGGSSGGGGDGGEEFASGGLVHGRGGIDNIPAWLTNREFVMRASAVRKYGEDFMHAINQGRIRVPRFNLGGLVSQLQDVGAPRFASGGPVVMGGGNSGGETTVWIGVPGVGRFGPMKASVNVADQMRRASVLSQVSSGGRTPRGG